MTKRGVWLLVLLILLMTVVGCSSVGAVDGGPDGATPVVLEPENAGYCWGNWSTNGGWEAMWALLEQPAPDILGGEGELPLPLFCIDSESELAALKETVEDHFDSDRGWDEAPSFSKTMASYNAVYFTDRVLLVTYVPSPSSSSRYGVGTISRLYDTLQLSVEYWGGNGDAMLAGWFLYAELPRSEVEDCTTFNAYKEGERFC